MHKHPRLIKFLLLRTGDCLAMAALYCPFWGLRHYTRGMACMYIPPLMPVTSVYCSRALTPSGPPICREGATQGLSAESAFTVRMRSMLPVADMRAAWHAKYLTPAQQG